jgi:Na+-translocating ferredoxin:NAD+ oxidoreductase RnfG subunit
MVNVQNNAGHTAIAMVINLALIAAVSAGIVAAVSSLVG